MTFHIIFLYMFLYLAYIIFDWSFIDLLAMTGAILWAWIKTSDK